MKSSLETARSRLSQTADADGDDTEADDILSRADGAGNGAGGGFPGFPGMGGGGGGGMPDLASLMNNPMMMQMWVHDLVSGPAFAFSRSPSLTMDCVDRAQQMMQNGGLEQLMQNPMLRNMVSSLLFLSLPSHLSRDLTTSYLSRQRAWDEEVDCRTRTRSNR